MQGINFQIEFPLDDGRVLVHSADGNRFVRAPYTYVGDGFATHHNPSCLVEPQFRKAYDRGIHSGHKIGGGGDLHIEWRVHLYCWAGWHAKQLEGDFVECGVNTGIFSLAIMEYTHFNETGKRFWLFDTYSGIPEDQFTEAERQIGLDQVHVDSYEDCWEIAQKNFAPYAGAQLVRGRVPESLHTVEIDKVAYLGIDMNSVVPEIAAAEHFWPKMVSGGIIMLDDYCWLHHVNQKTAFDKFASDRGVKILNLPTGQGVILKP